MKGVGRPSRAPRTRPRTGIPWRSVLRPAALGLAALLMLASGAGCEPSGSGILKPASAHSGPPSESQRFSQLAPPLLRDWPVDPYVDDEERGVSGLRIVCGGPSVSEACCALGLREQIVGRTTFCDHPRSLLAVPAFGALTDANVEALLEMKPDLVVLAGTSRLLTDRLAPHGLRLESLPDARLEDIFAGIRRLGERTGRARTAEHLERAVRAELDQVAAQFACRPGRSYLLALEPLSEPPAPPCVALAGSYHDDLLRRIGHRNVAGDAPGAAAYGMLSLEAILRADPDVIIELDPSGSRRPGGDVDAVRAWAQLGRLRAVEARRVHVLSGRQHHVPGPRVASTFWALAAAIAQEL
jgi:iron complex transport system substrate-binding protein